MSRAAAATTAEMTGAGTRARAAAWWTRARASPLAQLLAVGVATRVAVILVAWVSALNAPEAAASGWNRGPLFVRYFARWDSGYYGDISELGYGFKDEAWAFSPGYPLAVAAARWLLPVDTMTAGFLVSNAAFLASLALLYRLTAAFFAERVAWRAGVLYCLAPGSFYLSAVYADALFAALAFGAFLAMARERWVLAGALVSFAAITRPPGLFLTGALVLALALATWRDRRVPWRDAALAVPAALVMPALYLLYQWRETGNAFYTASVREVYWPNVQWHNPLTVRMFVGVPEDVSTIMYAGLVAITIVAAYVAWDVLARARVRAWPVHAFTLLMALVYVAYSELNPIVRYLVPIVPLYWMLGEATRNRWVFLVVAVASALGLAFVTRTFATWGPLY